ncbi:MAG: DUF748 domain-containing protein [bacterium]|nr:DUF748 domain-containing protein [bacterium]
MSAGRHIRWRRWVVRGLGALVVVVALLVVGLQLVDEPLRREMERRLNAALTGYTVTIQNLDLQPFALAIELEGVTVVQDARPSPPVVYLPRWKTSLQWKALLSGAVVADAEFDAPRLYLTRSQAEAEAADDTPAADRGWQDAVTSVHPLKINEVVVRDGALTYWDGKQDPVKLTDLDLDIDNIRNVRSAAGRYPSPVTASMRVAGGRIAFDGHADLLAKPAPVARGDLTARDVGLAPLAPSVRPFGVVLDGGRLGADVTIEYATAKTVVDVRDVTVDGAKVDYVQATAKDEERLDAAKRAATVAEAAPPVQIDVQQARLRGATLGFADHTVEPPFRLFVAGTDVTVKGFSNRKSDRKGTASLRGRFMDSGPLSIDATFASGAKRPEFTLALRLERVDLVRLNDLLRARADLDVNRGEMSFYTELAVRDGRVEGYAKPLFADLDIYDSEQDADDSIFQKAWEAMAGAAATVLQNRPRDEVATRADLSGPVEDPNASTFQIVVGLLRNAFFNAILPGLDPERRQGDRGTGGASHG